MKFGVIVCSRKNKIADADMAAELQGLQAGEERRGSNASQTGDSCLKVSWQQIDPVCAAVGPNQVEAFANAVLQRDQGKWSSPGSDARKK